MLGRRRYVICFCRTADKKLIICAFWAVIIKIMKHISENQKKIIVSKYITECFCSPQALWSCSKGLIINSFVSLQDFLLTIFTLRTPPTPLLHLIVLNRRMCWSCRLDLNHPFISLSRDREINGAVHRLLHMHASRQNKKLVYC